MISFEEPRLFKSRRPANVHLRGVDQPSDEDEELLGDGSAGSGDATGLGVSSRLAGRVGTKGKFLVEDVQAVHECGLWGVGRVWG